MNPYLNRRRFLSHTTLAGASLATAPLVSAQGSAKDSTIKVALIGCGGRGSRALGNFIDACAILNL
ncbi:MAG: twin-arginine translocation signal domain-containing protein [Verrucomicrobiales bacterium]